MVILNILLRQNTNECSILTMVLLSIMTKTIRPIYAIVVSNISLKARKIPAPESAAVSQVERDGGFRYRQINRFRDRQADIRIFRQIKRFRYRKIQAEINRFRVRQADIYIFRQIKRFRYRKIQAEINRFRVRLIQKQIGLG